jgi:hypothetical protein
MPDAPLKDQVAYLADLVARYKKDLEYYINNLDDENISSLTGAVITGLGKEYTDEEALAAWEASNYATYIDSSGVYTGTLTALQVNAVAINAGSITTGTLSGNRIRGGLISGTILKTNSSYENCVEIGTSGSRSIIKLYGSDEVACSLSCQEFGLLEITGPVYMSGSLEIETDLLVRDDAEITDNLTVGGNLDVGDYVTSDLVPSTDGAYDLGSDARRWNVYGAQAYFDGSSFYSNGVRDTAVTGDDVYVNSSAKLGYLSSTIKHKENIEPYVFDIDKLMNLEIVTFTYKKEIMDDQSVQYGVIAEQAIEAGLKDFVSFFPDGEVKAFKYSRLNVANLSLIQQQMRRIIALEERVSELEDK